MRLLHRLSRNQRGALTVEFALLAPVLAAFALGTIEFGLAWQDRLVVQSGVRAGARVGSALGAQTSADKNLLLNVGSALSAIGLDNVERVVVFRPIDANGTIPPDCITAPQGLPNQCNVYSGAQLRQLVENVASAASWFECGGTSLDRYWCPKDRRVNQLLGTDQLGVWVRARHDLLSGWFGQQVTITDSAVMRLEPGS